MKEKPKFQIDETVRIIDINVTGIVKGLAFTHHEDMFRYSINLKNSGLKVEKRENQLEKV